MKIRNLASAVLCALLLLILLPVTASANSPTLRPIYKIRVENVPEGTVYVDLLIPLETSDPAYAKLVEENLQEGFSEDAQIISYCEDGFCSYSLHYSGARSVTKLSPDHTVCFFTNDLSMQGVDLHDHKRDIEERGQVRLAMLDEKGNILQVSSVLTLKPRQLFAFLDGTFTYDAKTDSFVAGEYITAIGRLGYVLLAFCGLVFTCVTEFLTALVFRIPKLYRGTVVKVNIVSQILMHLLYILLRSFVSWPYSMAVLVLEILVYIGEYLYYRHCLAGVSDGKCIAFAVTANTVSLVGGTLLIWCVGLV